MTPTTRRFPRTLDEAFGPPSSPISGPYRSHCWADLALALVAVGVLLAAFMGAI